MDPAGNTDCQKFSDFILSIPSQPARCSNPAACVAVLEEALGLAVLLFKRFEGGSFSCNPLSIRTIRTGWLSCFSIAWVIVLTLGLPLEVWVVCRAL